MSSKRTNPRTVYEWMTDEGLTPDAYIHKLKARAVILERIATAAAKYDQCAGKWNDVQRALASLERFDRKGR